MRRGRTLCELIAPQSAAYNSTGSPVNWFCLTLNTLRSATSSRLTLIRTRTAAFYIEPYKHGFSGMEGGPTSSGANGAAPQNTVASRTQGGDGQRVRLPHSRRVTLNNSYGR